MQTKEFFGAGLKGKQCGNTDGTKRRNNKKTFL